MASAVRFSASGANPPRFTRSGRLRTYSWLARDKPRSHRPLPARSSDRDAPGDQPQPICQTLPRPRFRPGRRWPALIGSHASRSGPENRCWRSSRWRDYVVDHQPPLALVEQIEGEELLRSELVRGGEALQSIDEVGGALRQRRHRTDDLLEVLGYALRVRSLARQRSDHASQAIADRQQPPALECAGPPPASRRAPRAAPRPAHREG